MIVLSICICENGDKSRENKHRKQSVHVLKTTRYVGRLILRPEHLLEHDNWQKE